MQIVKKENATPNKRQRTVEVKKEKDKNEETVVAGKAKKLSLGISLQTPFPNFQCPSEEECRTVTSSLTHLHSDFMQAMDELDALNTW